MSYSEFDIVEVERRFGLATALAPLFPDSPTAAVPGWLADQLARGLRQPLMSEKARGELIVVPVLLACVEAAGRWPCTRAPGWTWIRRTG